MPPFTKVGAVLLLMLLAGCGVPPELQPRPGASVPVPSNPPPTSGAYPPGYTPRATASPAATPFPESSPIPCAGRPSAEQVVDLVKRETTARPTKAVVTPVCAGNWHYTVLEVPDKEPLQVLTKGDPAALTLVAVGTDVCTVDVRRQAPTGILLAASC
ncbi:MAG TPA: hypothetical protein DGT23_00190 [Micromonosporaceae bacterium]|nr:hypothetical protein [Micromonosporaceae bacterium]